MAEQEIMSMSRFDDVEHTPLRAFNRAVLFTNIMQDFGLNGARMYAEQFNDGEKTQMYFILMSIKDKGLDKVREWVTRDLVLEEDVDA